MTDYEDILHSKKSVLIFLLITIFFGPLGIHWFILGNIKKGALYFFTCGLFFVGWLSDIGKFLKIYLTIDKTENNKTNNSEEEASNIIRDFNTNNKNDNIYNIEEVNNGIDFEIYLSNILNSNGFQSYVTKSSNDYGVDVIAEKDMIKYAIQCKYYSNTVGISSIQQVITGKRYYECHVAVVATNSSFTKNAIELAKSNNVVLWDGEYIKSLANQTINN